MFALVTDRYPNIAPKRSLIVISTKTEKNNFKHKEGQQQQQPNYIFIRSLIAIKLLTNIMTLQASKNYECRLSRVCVLFWLLLYYGQSPLKIAEDPCAKIP